MFQLRNHGLLHLVGGCRPSRLSDSTTSSTSSSTPDAVRWWRVHRATTVPAVLWLQFSVSPPRSPGKMPQDNEKVSSSARDGKDVLGFDIVRRPWSSWDAMKEMDAAETFVLLQERGKDIYSDDEPGVDYSGIKSAADNPHEVLTVCSDKKTSAV